MCLKVSDGHMGPLGKLRKFVWLNSLIKIGQKMPKPGKKYYRPIYEFGIKRSAIFRRLTYSKSSQSPLGEKFLHPIKVFLP